MYWAEYTVLLISFNSLFIKMLVGMPSMTLTLVLQFVQTDFLGGEEERMRE